MSFDYAGLVLLAAYALLLGAGAVQDVLSLRISNAISIAVLLVCVAALVAVGPSEWWQHPLSFIIVFLIGILLFRLNWVGGGDVKLLSASALAFDFGGLLRFVPTVLLAGGLIGLGFLIFHSISGGSIRKGRRASVPYGVAIAVGGITAALMFPTMSAFAPAPTTPLMPEYLETLKV